MLKHAMALTGLVAAVACSRSEPDREVGAGEVPRRELEIARAEEPRPEPEQRATPAPHSAESRIDSAAFVTDSTIDTTGSAIDTAPSSEATIGPRIDTAATKVDTAAAQSPAEPTTPADSVPVTPPAPGAEPADTSDTVAYMPYPAAESQPQPGESASASPSARAGGVLATGTVIYAMIEDSIHSRIDVSGKEVRARVMEGVSGRDGAVLIPPGAPVHLTVTQVKPGRGERKGVLEIRTDSITIAQGAMKLDATIRSVPHELRGRGVTGEEAAKVGAGAVGGAVVGRVITGDAEGAIIGGVVGAAGGAAVASASAAKDVVVKANTPVELRLTAPLRIR